MSEINTPNVGGQAQVEVLTGRDSMLAAHADTLLSLDPEKVKSLGRKLYSRWERYEKERRPLEIKWLRNLRQFLGEYDPEIKNLLDPQRSQAYPRLTRVKSISMTSRLMNMMFPASDKNWSVGPTPVPNLPADAVERAIALAQQVASQEGVQLSGHAIEASVMNEAKERARKLEKEIEDQLSEIGGSKLLNYPQLARSVVFSGVLYGVGVAKGPTTAIRKKRAWRLDEVGGYIPEVQEVVRPLLESCNIWGWYPDMTASSITRQSGTFERLVYTRSELKGLTYREGFRNEVINKYLANHREGNYKRRTYEQELRTMGPSINTTLDQDGNKYEIVIWYGPESAHTLSDCGVPVPEELKDGEVYIELWMLDNEVIKVEISPWYDLLDRHVPTFHYFIFEEDDTSIVGNGLPNVMRDSQLAVCASSRMMLDNGSVVCGPQLELNTTLLRADQDINSIHAYKIWYREGDGIDAQYPAVREIKIDSHLGELQGIMKVFMEFADIETFVNPATGGDLQKGPSEPFRTAAGASMLRGDMALPFKDVVRNFDKWTESVIGALIDFNQAFNADPAIQGDYEAQPRGLSSLVAKEVRAMTLDQFVATLTEEDKLWIDNKQLLIERASTRDLPIDTILVDQATYERRKSQASQAAMEQQEQQKKLIEATVRKVLADALKSMTQADKNASAARVQELNAVFSALEAPLQDNPSAGGNGAKPGSRQGG